MVSAQATILYNEFDNYTFKNDYHIFQGTMSSAHTMHHQDISNHGIDYLGKLVLEIYFKQLWNFVRWGNVIMYLNSQEWRPYSHQLQGYVHTSEEQWILRRSIGWVAVCSPSYFLWNIHNKHIASGWGTGERVSFVSSNIYFFPTLLACFMYLCWELCTAYLLLTFNMQGPN